MGDFDYDLAQRKATPKKGRRAGVKDYVEIPEDLLSPIGSPVNSPQKAPPSGMPSKRRSLGWSSAAVGGRSALGAQNEPDRRFQLEDEDDGDEDIPVIPDLDEVYEEDFTQQVAQAPSVPVNSVATFKELDSDLLRHTAFTTLDDIDLRLLTSALYSESQVREPDVEWTWDGLFAEICSDFLTEAEKKETNEE